MGDTPVVIHFDISPDRLPCQPKRATQSEQHPEGFLAPVRGDCINQQCPIDKNRHQAKEEVCGLDPTCSCGNPLANSDESSQQDEPGGCDVTVHSESRFHSPTDSLSYRMREKDPIRRGTGMTKT